MQDRPDMNVDPTLVNRGWEQMNKQLDEIMPVRKRRFPLWILLLFFVISASSLGVYNVLQGRQDVHENPIQPAVIPSTELLKNKPIAEHQPEKPFINQNTIAPAKEPLNKMPQPSKNNTVLYAAKMEKATPEMANNYTAHKQTAKHIPVAETPALENSQTNSSNIPPPYPSQLQKTTISKKDHKELSLLLNGDIALLDNKTVKLKKNLSFNTARSIRLFASTEITVNNFTPRGLAFGVGLQKPLSRRISLEFMLNYQFISPNLRSDNSDPNSDSESIFLVANNAFSTPALANSRLVVQKINLPVKIRFKMGHRWHLAAGIQLAYYKQAFITFGEQRETVMSANTSSPLVNLYGESLSFYSLDLISNTITERNELQFNRWQWSSLLSTQYQLSKRMVVEATYQRNITNWADNSEVYDTKSFLSLGLRYYLNTPDRLVRQFKIIN